LNFISKHLIVCFRFVKLRFDFVRFRKPVTCRLVSSSPVLNLRCNLQLLPAIPASPRKNFSPSDFLSLRLSVVANFAEMSGDWDRDNNGDPAIQSMLTCLSGYDNGESGSRERERDWEREPRRSPSPRSRSPRRERSPHRYVPKVTVTV
jgi:hypothetical protein